MITPWLVGWLQYIIPRGMADLHALIQCHGLSGQSINPVTEAVSDHRLALDNRLSLITCPDRALAPLDPDHALGDIFVVYLISVHLSSLPRASSGRSTG